MAFNLSSAEETDALLSDPEERYLPHRYYTGRLSAISEGEDEAALHPSRPPSPSSNSKKHHLISPELNELVRATRSSLQMNSLWDRIRYQMRPQTFAFLHIAAGTILATGYMIFLPLYTGGLHIAGSDPYVACLLASMWFPVLFLIVLGLIKVFFHRKIPLIPPLSWSKMLRISVPLTISMLMVFYCSPPIRLPVHLQPILTSLLLPASAVARFFIVKKGISRLQILCLGLQVMGVFVAVWPVIFQLGEKRKGLEWLYILLFILGWLPGVAGFVFAISCLSNRRAHTFSILSWTHLLILVGVVFLFWTNFIPGLGTVHTVNDFANHVQIGFSCFYNGGNSSAYCSVIPGRSALFLLTYTFAFSTLMVILRFKDGLSYFAVIIGLASLFSTVFWSIFLDVELNIEISPGIEGSDTVFLFVGILSVALAIASFIYLAFVPPPLPPRPPVRRRRTSSSRTSFSQPEETKRRKLRKSRSAPNFNIYL